MRLLTALLFVCLALAVPAEAQIYSWRDAAGHLVLSTRARGGESVRAATFAVPGASSIRTTRPTPRQVPSRFDDLIGTHAARHGLSPDLVRAVIQAESGFNPLAVSSKGAMGLMQLMPGTARELGVSDPFHPDDNIRGGVSYLARLLARYDQNLELALAAYNAGPGAVERYGAVPPFRETQQYVRRITSRPITPPDAPAPTRSAIYKWTEIVNGRATTRYSNVAPIGREFAVVGGR